MVKTFEQVYNVCKNLYEDPYFVSYVKVLIDDYTELNYNKVLDFFRQRYPEYTAVLFDQRSQRFFESNTIYGSEKLYDIVVQMQTSFALSYLYVQPFQNIRARGLFRKMIRDGYGYREGRRASLKHKEDIILYRHVSKAYASNERLKSPWVLNILDKPQTPLV